MINFFDWALISNVGYPVNQRASSVLRTGSQQKIFKNIFIQLYIFIEAGVWAPYLLTYNEKRAYGMVIITSTILVFYIFEVEVSYEIAQTLIIGRTIKCLFVCFPKKEKKYMS